MELHHERELGHGGGPLALRVLPILDDPAQGRKTKYSRLSGKRRRPTQSRNRSDLAANSCKDNLNR